MKKRILLTILAGTLLLGGCGKKESDATSEADASSVSTESHVEDSSVLAESFIADSSVVAESTLSTSSAKGNGQEAASASQTPDGSTSNNTTPEPTPEPVDTTPQPIFFDESWEFGENSEIHSGNAVLYKAAENRKNLVIGVNAGHGCDGGSSVRTFCHPDQTPKVTGGSTAEGSVTATACATGMDFYDGTPEKDVTLMEAQILKDLLLNDGYDVLMIREGDDVQLDNVARTLICNNYADCHIAIHWDGDDLDYDKGCYYMSVPDALKSMYPVSETWQKSDHLGDCLINGLSSQGCSIFESGSMQMDLTQTSYSKVPSIDIELGNGSSDHSQPVLENLALGLLKGVQLYFAE